MTTNNLFFFANELMTPRIRHKMHLPLHFVCFAHIRGKLYSMYDVKNNRGRTFVAKGTKQWGNNVVYGAIFVCHNLFFYKDILDAYNLCSMSTLQKNHHMDLSHRVELMATPINFSSLEDLSRLLYDEREPIKVQTYLANPNHPKIKQRITDMKHPHRIISGINAKNFKELYKEVCLNGFKENL